MLSPRLGASASLQEDLDKAQAHVMLPGGPPNFIWSHGRISTWGNVGTSEQDPGYGNCVTAEEAFAKACHRPSIFITDHEVIRWAGEHGALNGARLADVLKAMRNDGFHQDGNLYCVGNFYKVDWTDESTIRSAITVGPVKIGCGANQISGIWTNSGGQNGWFAYNLRRERHIDHCVCLSGYGTISWLANKLGVNVPPGVDGDATGYSMFTWGSIGIIDHDSMVNITKEAWVRNPTEIGRAHV